METNDQTATDAIDELLTKPLPTAPFPLIKTFGPLTKEDTAKLDGLSQRREDLEALLQDKDFWVSYRLRNKRPATTDHRCHLRDQVDQMNREIYALANPGAPTIAEQGRAYAGALKAKKEMESSRKGDPHPLLMILFVCALVAGMAGAVAGLGYLARNNPLTNSGQVR